MKQLREAIETAFSDGRHPDSQNLTSCPCDECREIRDYFAHRDWRGHTIEQLRNIETALFHLSPQGFRYFLPAFCLATLENSQLAEAIPDLIVFNLSPRETTLAQERVDQLSVAERLVMIRFLDHLVHANISDYDAVEPARQLLTSTLLIPAQPCERLEPE